MKEKKFSNYTTFSLNKVEAPRKEKNTPKSSVNYPKSSNTRTRDKK